MTAPAQDPLRELAEEIAAKESPDLYPFATLAGRRDAWEARLRSALPSVSSLLGELARVRGALEPFAREADRWSDAAPGETRLTAVSIGAGSIGTLEDLRRARSALAPGSGQLAGEVLAAVMENAAQQPEGYWIVRLPNDLIAPLRALLPSPPPGEGGAG